MTRKERTIEADGNSYIVRHEPSVEMNNLIGRSDALTEFFMEDGNVYWRVYTIEGHKEDAEELIRRLESYYEFRRAGE